MNVIAGTENRWFSELDVMRRLLININSIRRVIEEESEEIENIELRQCYIEDYLFNRGEIELLDFFIEVFSEMQKEATFLSSENIGTLSFVIPTIRMLINYYENKIELQK